MNALRLVHNSYEPNKRDYVNRLAQHEPKTGVLFTEFIDQTVRHRAKRKSQNYSKGYKTLINHINDFSEKYDANIFTNSVNEFFLDDFIMFLQNKGLRQNYVLTLIQLTKGMTANAGMQGYAVDKSYKLVDVKPEATFAVYLSVIEITRIYYFQGLTKAEERIKDLFILGCWTGLRYSDYSSLTRDNFQGDYIVKITKKTRTKVAIPIHEIILELIKKYDSEISPGLSNQHFNRYIKAVCKKVGLDAPITYHFTQGGEIKCVTKPKYELISSHTARRSFATNMYQTKRMSAFDIMSITGHSTEKSFFKYIKVTKEDTVKQIAGDCFFRI